MEKNLLINASKPSKSLFTVQWLRNFNHITRFIQPIARGQTEFLDSCKWNQDHLKKWAWSKVRNYTRARITLQHSSNPDYRQTFQIPVNPCLNLAKPRETGTKLWKHSDKMADELIQSVIRVRSWNKNIQFEEYTGGISYSKYQL